MMTVTLMNGRWAEIADGDYAEASRRVRAEIDASGVGGTEWSEHRAGRIFEGRRQVAHVSYNGKVWAGRSLRSGSTPIWPVAGKAA